jgi:serine/threonine protein kinase
LKSFCVGVLALDETMLKSFLIFPYRNGNYGKKYARSTPRNLSEKDSSTPVSSDGEDVSPCETHRVVTVQKRIEALVGNLTDRYVVLNLIHDGGQQCRIKRVRSKEDGTEYAVKIQAKKNLRAESEALFRRGIEGLMNMPESKHVVQIHGCFEDSHYFYTFQELCQGGSLAHFLELLCDGNLDNKTREDEVRQVMHELLLSLDHLHKQGLVHKDVKVENLVFKKKGSLYPRLPGSPGGRSSPSKASPKVSQTASPNGLSKRPTELKLIDFDSMEEYKRPRSKIVLGTDGYIAPEAYLGYACPKSDIFSAGVIMFVLMSGRLPYDDALFDDGPGENYVGCSAMNTIQSRLQISKVRFGKAWEEVDDAKGFCKALMRLDVEKRLTAEEALKHPWMTKLTQTEVKKKKSYFSVSF